MSKVNIILSTFAPFNTISFSVPSDLPAQASLSQICTPICPIPSQSLSLLNGRSLPKNASFASLLAPGCSHVDVRLSVKLPGGKGGFGSQLRAAGGRMTSKRGTNNDSCRDLNGRRLNTIKEAKKLAEYLQSAPEREKAAKDAAKEKLERLREEIKRLESQAGEPSTSKDPKTGETQEAAAPKKRRLDDQAFVEESRDINDNVRNAVAAALLKKRKKAKKDVPAPAVPESAPVAVEAAA